MITLILHIDRLIFSIISDSPTLLVCSSCALALQLSGYIAMHLDDSPVEIEPSQKIMEVDNGSDRDKSSRIHQLSNSWRHADTLFHVMEKVKQTGFGPSNFNSLTYNLTK